MTDHAPENLRDGRCDSQFGVICEDGTFRHFARDHYDHLFGRRRVWRQRRTNCIAKHTDAAIN